MAPQPRYRLRRLFAGTALAVMLFLPLPGALDVFDSGIYLLSEDVTQDEDAYVLASFGAVDGIIDGDLVIAANSVRITGTVTGDVLVASNGTVAISGTVEGSVRGVGREIRIEPGGIVGDDLAVAALTTRVQGDVNRDLIVFGGRLDLTGRVGRDVHGRFVKGHIGGEIGRNVDIATSSLEVGAGAVVGGHLLYRSNRSADADPEARIVGRFERLSPRPSFFVDFWWTLATVLGFLAFLFSGILLLWLLPDTSARAVGAILTRPWRTLAFGIGVILVLPLAVLAFAFSLVGVPVAALLAVAYLLGFFFGPIPAVAAVGARLLRKRGGVFGAFVAGAIVWRLGIAVLKFVAGALYVAALVWGAGGWAAAVWEGRSHPYPETAPGSTTAST